MVRVLVIELDDGVRSALRDVLCFAGYEVLDEVTTLEAGLAVLDTSLHSRVVLVSNGDADHQLTARFFAQVVADERLATRHQYLLLTTTPSHLPANLAAQVEQLHAEVCPKPFDIDQLLACVSRASERLTPGDLDQLDEAKGA